MISLIIPTYNQAGILEQNIKEIYRAMTKYFGHSFEIIVVEESTDNTAEIISSLSKKMPNLRHIHSERRLGKGGAIEKGILASKSENIIFMDPDLATDMSSLPDLADGLKEYDIVMGSRYLGDSRANRTVFRLVLSKSYLFLVKMLLRLPYKDLQCGFKAMRKSEARRIFPLVRNKSFFWDTEFIFYAHKKGLKIHEIPIQWHEVGQKAPAVTKMLSALLKLRFCQ